jgi:predicted phosphoadenosine phosphosulfate sulfurtransferase
MKTKIKDYIATWERRCYADGIPDEVPIRIYQLNKAPSYKAIVRAILKNDNTLKTLGFTTAKCNTYHEFKRVELSQRNTPKQLSLF